MKKSLIAGVALVGLAVAPGFAQAEAVNPIFGKATAIVNTTADNQKVVGKGYYADLYGYYGNYYNNLAGYYGLYGAYLKSASYYYYASSYAYNAYQYYNYAYQYQSSGS
jgi:hypothetical protein